MELLKIFQNKRLLAMSLALCLVLCTIIGGTVAWLIDETDPVVNTFTYGDINITLTETNTNDGDGNPNTNKYFLLPGQTITKDPKVTVKANSEACWLFVKLEEELDSTTHTFGDYLTYAIADGWTALDAANHPGVYYREVPNSDQPAAFGVIKDDTVTMKEDVTKDMLNALTDYPTLTITAYAVQAAGSTDAAAAWAKIPTNP